jgi:hypothetical protein
MIRQEDKPMPAHAEEMYDPDVFGKSGAGILKVKMEE